MNQLLARMAEMVVSSRDGDVLVCLGLGSCIGLALLETSQRVSALAHIVLPTSNAESPGSAAKFADTAVPALVEEMTRLGARRSALCAVTVGGAQMFALGGGMDIGARNDRAVREALVQLRIPLVASMTGGSVGRTMRVYVGAGRVTCRAAGGDEIDLMTTMRAAV